MLEAEADGLRELARANAIRIPRVLGVGVEASAAWLALEWIEYSAATASTESFLGEQLALQHRVTADSYGWRRDNTIGSTPQPNCWDGDWIRFLREHRLRHQLDLACAKGYAGPLQERGERLLECLAAFFPGPRPVASLLHGDLWGGNWAADVHGAPVVFDPAVYFGDREADIAMTRLFGGFGADFYAAYQAAWPLEAGATERADLYNLYHVLNHLSLFGAGYLAQAQRLIDRSLARVAA